MTTVTNSSTSRCWPPAARISSSTSRAVSGSPTPAPPSPPRRPAPPSSSISRSPRGASRTRGTRRRRWPPYRSRSAPTPPSSSAMRHGANPGRRCSFRPPMCVRRRSPPRGAPAHLVRRALDRFRLRAVRGEPALFPAPALHRRGRGPAAGAGRGRGARAPGTGAAQRHDLPLEPARLRCRGRCSASARGEPCASGGAHRHRCHRQRRLLLRTGQGARRGVPPGVDPAAVRGRRRQLRRGLPATASTRSCSGPDPAGRPPWPAPPPYGWSARSCCRSPRPASTPGAWSPPTATAISA